MRRTITFIAATAAIAFGQTLATASPGHGMTNGQGPRTPSPTTAPGNGQVNGTGYNHMNSGQARGQPNQSCETAGITPGNAGSAPGGGSPFTGDGSNAGAHYAGSQAQNSRNTASVSQYDVACANQPH